MTFTLDFRNTRNGSSYKITSCQVTRFLKTPLFGAKVSFSFQDILFPQLFSIYILKHRYHRWRHQVYFTEMTSSDGFMLHTDE